MKPFSLLLSVLCLWLPAHLYSQANAVTKPIPAAPPSITAANPDISVLDGVWKVNWNDETWTHGSLFEIQSGKVGGTAYQVVVQGGKTLLQGPNIPPGILIEAPGNGTWTAVWGKRSFSASPHTVKAPSSLLTQSLNGIWNCRDYSGNSIPITVSNSSVTGWGEAGTASLETGRVSVLFPNGTQFLLYFVSPDEWLGFGKFPSATGVTYSPIVWQRSTNP